MGTTALPLPHSRLEPLIPQDLQATVPCVPVFVCLQALQDSSTAQGSVASPAPLSKPSTPFVVPPPPASGS